MDGNKINDCVTILNKLLIPNYTLSSGERKQLLTFFVEEKIKAIKIYEKNVYEKAQEVLLAIKDRKEALIRNKEYEATARLRDLEKSYLQVVLMFKEFKRNNIKATFSYGVQGLSLILVEGDFKHTIEELKKIGLHLNYFSKTLENINL